MTESVICPIVLTDDVPRQYERLRRHYIDVVVRLDSVSMLDLSHTLRLWAEAKSQLDTWVRQSGRALSLPFYSIPAKIKDILRGTRHVYAPLASGLALPHAELREYFYCEKEFERRRFEALFAKQAGWHDHCATIIARLWER